MAILKTVLPRPYIESYAEKFALPALKMPKYAALRMQDEEDITDWMLHQAGQYPLFKPEEEIQIAKVLQAWRELQQAAAEANFVDPAKLQDLELVSFAQTSGMNVKEALFLKRQGMRGRELMIHCNQRLVIKMAKQYKRKYNVQHLKLIDLIQAGKIGLIKAVDRFDVKAGCKFSTYAFQWIRQALGEACKTQERTIRFPVYVEEIRGKVVNAAEQLQSTTSFTQPQPTLESIAMVANLTPDRVRKSLALPMVAASTNEVVGKEEKEELGALLADRRSNPEAQIIEQESLEMLDSLISILNYKEQKILRLFWGFDGKALSKPDIAAYLGMSFSAVSYALRSALMKLRIAAADRHLTIKDFLD